jgi:hypothetical protein
MPVEDEDAVPVVVVGPLVLDVAVVGLLAPVDLVDVVPDPVVDGPPAPSPEPPTSSNPGSGGSSPQAADRLPTTQTNPTKQKPKTRIEQPRG